ncbi:unnamed protein product [Pleuronectes platessa]|uniref:Uncharacterized protein n=1 Tax=Pleuronectes platessa TaxID=8262 RepID=A0A9N7U5V7_PLEPL|nr:unnamed protein product [Pleuronectes platessa]
MGGFRWRLGGRQEEAGPLCGRNEAAHLFTPADPMYVGERGPCVHSSRARRYMGRGSDRVLGCETDASIELSVIPPQTQTETARICISSCNSDRCEAKNVLKGTGVEPRVGKLACLLGWQADWLAGESGLSDCLARQPMGEVICRLRPHKSQLYDEHSAYDLWSTEEAS